MRFNKNAQEQKICFVGLGSNLGDSLIVLQEAWRAIAGQDSIEAKKISSPYQTSPVGMASDNVFVNAVGMLHTEIGPHRLLDLLLQVESDFGRMRKKGVGYQDRILDLDLLYYGDLHLESERLTLPHPHIGERLFVLTPLVELNDRWRDPKTDLTVFEMEDRLHSLIRNNECGEQFIEKVSWRD